MVRTLKPEIHALGFTGTQNELTHPQIFRLTHLMKWLLDEHFYERLHHGDCIGGDKTAHHLWKGFAPEYTTFVTIHPPLDPKKRAFCENREGDILHREREYLDRNKDIVHAVDRLLVAPSGMTPIIRSGTWSTFRYANRLLKPIHIVYPNGGVENYNV